MTSPARYLEANPEGAVVRSATAFLIGAFTILALVTMGNTVVFHGGTAGQTPVPISVLLLLMQWMAAIAGGYVAAWIARHRPTAHGLGAAVLYLISLQFAPAALAVLTHLPASRPLWVAGTAVGLTLLGGVLGGAVRRSKT